MSQTERVFYILDLLLEKGFFTRKEVAEHFGVSIKQVYRDKEYLMTRCPLGFGNLDIVYDRERNVLTVLKSREEGLRSGQLKRPLMLLRAERKGICRRRCCGRAGLFCIKAMRVSLSLPLCIIQQTREIAATLQGGQVNHGIII